MFNFLIHLDRAKHLSHKPQCRKRPNSSSCDENRKTQQKHISKVQNISEQQFTWIQSMEPNNTVPKDVKGYTTTCNHSQPPPSMILGN